MNSIYSAFSVLSFHHMEGRDITEFCTILQQNVSETGWRELPRHQSLEIHSSYSIIFRQGWSVCVFICFTLKSKVITTLFCSWFVLYPLLTATELSNAIMCMFKQTLISIHHWMGRQQDIGASKLQISPSYLPVLCADPRLQSSVCYIFSFPFALCDLGMWSLQDVKYYHSVISWWERGGKFVYPGILSCPFQWLSFQKGSEENKVYDYRYLKVSVIGLKYIEYIESTAWIDGDVFI